MEESGKNIVILGAGYGGVMAALRLARLFRDSSSYRILLIDKNPFHTLKTRLHEAAVHNREVTIDIGRIIRHRKIGFHLGTVISIDPSGHTVALDDKTLRFEYLLIALGSQVNFYNIPGLQAFAFPLQSASDAEKIFKHIAGICARASSEPDVSKRRTMLRFVIGGGGLSGVEFVGELVDHVQRMMENYAIAHDDVDIVLVEASDRILPSLDMALRERIEQRLREMKVKVLTKSPVASVNRESVTLVGGEILRTNTVVWTGGIRIADIVTNSGMSTGSMGRIVVDAFLRSVDHPHVFAIGDNALAMNPVTNRPVPAAAQFALQQGRLVAENIHADVTSGKLRAYTPKVLGEVVSLGRHLAAGWVALPPLSKIKFFGFLASLLKSAIAEKHILLLRKESRNWITY